jgi:hypothetical protein
MGPEPSSSYFIEAWPADEEPLYGSTSPGVTDNQRAFGGLTEGTNLGVGSEGEAKCSHDC